MSPRQQKVHVVSVRFTEDEFRHLTEACEAEQSRSLSEFARAVMKERLTLSAPRGALREQDTRVVARGLQLLYAELQAAAQRVADMLGDHDGGFSAPDAGSANNAESVLE